MSKKKMVNITISLPEIFIENIERFQNAGIVASRRTQFAPPKSRIFRRRNGYNIITGFEIEEGESSEET